MAFILNGKAPFGLRHRVSLPASAHIGVTRARGGFFQEVSRGC
jgi:hypothetical protein